jgi:oligopeptide/dipeptide ABC transporter ATP-binding protein
MYLGRIVELNDSDSLFENPLHPYTQALLSAVPEPTPGRIRQRVELKGDVANPANPPPGCPFHPRCQRLDIDETCRSSSPELEPGSGGGLAACHKIGSPAPGQLG